MVHSVGQTETFRFEDDDYEVVSVLGAGGMGTVYKARQKSLARFVAIKTMNAIACTDPESVARFKREAAAAAHVVHPNIIGVHSIDVDPETNLPFMVMEYLEGESLIALVERRGPLAEAEAVPIFEHVLDALAALHDAGLVHRDVKPHNIFVTTDGVIKLMDLGIVKSLNGEAQRLTQTGATLGSPAYMSPEQCSGEADLDGRSDLYSLGCSLYRVLSGVEPFPGETALEVMFMHLHDPAPSIASKVSPHVAATIAKAMEKRREDRFASAAEFKSALLGCDPTCVAPPPSARAKRVGATPWWQAPRAVAWGFGLTIALGGAIFAWSQPRQTGVAALPPYVQRMYHCQDGSSPHEVLRSVSKELDKDKAFWKLSDAEKATSLRPVEDYAKAELDKALKKKDWQLVFWLQVQRAKIMACYDKTGAYKMLRENIDSNRQIDGKAHEQWIWNRLTGTYVASLSVLESRGYTTEFNELFDEFLKLRAPNPGLNNENASGAYLVAADYHARYGRFAEAERMARKALELRKKDELTGTIDQLEAHEKLCHEIFAQQKWKELVHEVDAGWEDSKEIMDVACDRLIARQRRARMAHLAVEACEHLGDAKNAARFRHREQEETRGSDVNRAPII